MISLNPDGLDIRKLADSVDAAKLAAVPGPFYAAERHTGIRHHHLVDEDHAGVDLIGEAVAFGGIVRPGACSEAETAVVGERDSAVNVFDAENAGHRAK